MSYRKYFYGKWNQKKFPLQIQLYHHIKTVYFTCNKRFEYAYTCVYMRIQKVYYMYYTHARSFSYNIHTIQHTRTRTHARTHAHARTHTHPPTHPRTHAHTHTHTHTHARTHARARAPARCLLYPLSHELNETRLSWIIKQCAICHYDTYDQNSPVQLLWPTRTVLSERLISRRLNARRYICVRDAICWLSL